MKKNILTIITIVIPAFILFVCIFYNDSPVNIIQVLKDTKLRWLACAALSMVVSWFLESLSLHIMSNKISKKLKFKNAIQTSMIGQLFNCITPFASGGQPMQAYCMVKCGIPIGQASSILLTKFIIYQIVLTVYSLLALIFKFKFFADSVSGFGYLVLVGFFINLIVVVCLAGIGFFPKITKKFLNLIIRILSKFNLVKNKEEKIKSVDTEMDNFYESFQFFRQNIFAIIQSSIIMFLQLTAFFIIPYFICLALGVPNIDLLTIISAGAFVLMITSFVPLPGGSGGAETGFYLFFSIFFPQTGVIAIAILIWRAFTFYMPIIAGMLFSNAIKSKKLAN